jgi:hypothetical protein
MTAVNGEQCWIDYTVKIMWLRRIQSGTNVYNTRRTNRRDDGLKEMAMI